MEQPPDIDPRSFWERMQSRPRFRWLTDRAFDLVAATAGAPAEQDVALDDQPAPEANSEEQPVPIKASEQLLSLIEPGTELDPFEYARYRREQKDWLTMEIGPGFRPSGLMRRDFKGKSAYIGIENHSFVQYSDGADAMFASFRELRPDDHIFLRSDPNFGRAEDGSMNYYDFPDGTADEIYVSRVYDKPKDTSERLDDEEAMTAEAARLLKPGGKVLIFDFDRNIDNIAGWLTKAGLKLRFAFEAFMMDPETGETITSGDELLKLQSELDCLEGSLILIAEKPQNWTRASAGNIRAPLYPAPIAR